MLKFKVVTYEEWDDARLSGTWNFIDIGLTSRQRKFAYACFRIRQTDSGLEGQVFRKCFFNGVSDPAGTPVSVSRPDAHSLTAAFPRRWIARRLTEFEWQAVTSFEDSQWPGCEPPRTLPPEKPYGTCTDFTKFMTHRA
ncbi:MAG: hypothetical protein LC808_03520 [Actinobacteria bacterium]|nr:hypothetical protein [Actinomycetota bacterium]